MSRPARPPTRGDAPARSRLALLLAVGLAAGCSEELGPERPETARVTGRIHIGGSPVGGGWVEFYPVEGAVGVLRSAPLRDDGTFEAMGVAAGPNLIRLAHPGPRPTTPYLAPTTYWLFQQPSSPIRRAIRPPGEALDIDLRAEAARPEALRALDLLARGAG